LWQSPEGRIGHGVSPLLIEILAGINQQDTPTPLSLHTPEMTISQSVQPLVDFFDCIFLPQCLMKYKESDGENKIKMIRSYRW
jgi:hypothetical protein